MKHIALLLLIGSLGLACKNSKNSQSNATENENTFMNEHNSRNSLDWSGVYTGTLPCADCEGIYTRLMINDSQYFLTTSYLGKEANLFETNGFFEWKENGSTIVLDGIENGPNQFKVEENRLRQLDLSGQIITGELQNLYFLNKLMHPALDTEWILTELHGEAVTYKENSRKITLTLNSENGRYNGFGGCNSYMGEFDIDTDNNVTFNKGIATLMACDDLALESKYTNAIKQAAQLQLDNDILTLLDAESNVLTRYKR